MWTVDRGYQWCKVVGVLFFQISLSKKKRASAYIWNVMIGSCCCTTLPTLAQRWWSHDVLWFVNSGSDCISSCVLVCGFGASHFDDPWGNCLRRQGLRSSAILYPSMMLHSGLKQCCFSSGWSTLNILASPTWSNPLPYLQVAHVEPNQKNLWHWL